MQSTEPTQPQSSTPNASNVKSFLQRTYQIPMWGLIIAGCVMCGLLAHTVNPGSNTNTTSASGDVKTAAPKATNTPKTAAKWTTVQTFTGNGNQQTEVFTVGNNWRINWSCTPSSYGDAPIFVNIHKSDGTTSFDFSDVSTTCKTGNTSGTTNEHAAGSLYLEVLSGIDWKLEVQDFK